MKLRPELVPKPLFGISAYRLLGRRAEWKGIRLDALRTNGNQCSVCGTGGKGLTCHESWDYDDRQRHATLVALVVHCPDCDTATHMGRAVKHGRGNVAVAQLCRVNGCTEDLARKVFTEAMAVWRRRSGYDWTTFVADSLLTRHPALVALHNKEVTNTLRPSEERGPLFLWAYARGTGYPSPTERSGKWLIFVPKGDVDAVWLKIRDALRDGKLGACAKVSTAGPNSNSPDPNRHVICVYTHDSEDVKDVRRIRGSLRDLGFVGRLSYKIDAATEAGRYRARGHRGISKYSK